MRWTFAVFVSVALAAAIVGCSSSPATTPTPGATQAPGQTATPAATQAQGATPTPANATATPGSTGATGLTGHECDAVPTFSISNPNPSFPPDTALEAHFPATIDGQPVTDVTSQQWYYYICMTQGQAGLEQAAGQAGGFNLATLSWGSATATVDGDSIDLTAFRTAGQDANTMVQYLALLAAQSGTVINPGNVTQSNIGGKTVYVWTDSDGTKNYAVVLGDTLVFFDSVTDSEATKIASALL